MVEVPGVEPGSKKVPLFEFTLIASIYTSFPPGKSGTSITKEGMRIVPTLKPPLGTAKR